MLYSQSCLELKSTVKIEECHGHPRTDGLLKIKDDDGNIFVSWEDPCIFQILSIILLFIISFRLIFKRSSSAGIIRFFYDFLS